jgi:hypothetical protein
LHIDITIVAHLPWRSQSALAVIVATAALTKTAMAINYELLARIDRT